MQVPNLGWPIFSIVFRCYVKSSPLKFETELKRRLHLQTHATSGFGVSTSCTTSPYNSRTIDSKHRNCVSSKDGGSQVSKDLIGICQDLEEFLPMWTTFLRGFTFICRIISPSCWIRKPTALLCTDHLDWPTANISPKIYHIRCCRIFVHQQLYVFWCYKTTTHPTKCESKSDLPIWIASIDWWQRRFALPLGSRQLDS